MPQEWMVWIGFNLFVVLMLILDLGVFHRTPHEVKFKEAMLWSGVWVGLALIFNAILFVSRGQQAGMEFLAGYLIEKSLSVDNIFVFVMIFAYFKVPAKYQHEVLFWGIVGALIMRAIFIAGGVTLLEKFHWLIYLFGAFLILTGIKMVAHKDKEVHPEKNLLVRLFRKLMPVTHEYQGGKFFVRKNGTLWATPLFVVLLVIETTDVIFAVDSIPAILAVTRDPFIVYSSNIFAILGLRALYFAVAGIVNAFHLLHYGLSAVLVFVGTKMMLADLYKVPIHVSLLTIFTLLAVSVILSMVFPKKEKQGVAGT